MEVPKSRKDQKNRRIKCLELNDPTTNHYQYDKSKVREQAGKIIDEIQQELDPENIISRIRPKLKYALGFYDNWKSVDLNSTLASLKIKIDKLTFPHGTYPDKKKKLNHRMLHEVRDMDAERCLLKMHNSKKHKESVKELEEEGKLREFDQDSMLSKKEIQKQIKVLEKRREEDIKVILDKRKKLESIKREMTRARPCSVMVWGICKHPKKHEFDPFLWGLCGCTCQKPLSKKNRETIISNMKMKSLREKLECIRGQRQRAFLNFLDQLDDLDYGVPTSRRERDEICL